MQDIEYLLIYEYQSMRTSFRNLSLLRFLTRLRRPARSVLSSEYQRTEIQAKRFIPGTKRAQIVELMWENNTSGILLNYPPLLLSGGSPAEGPGGWTARTVRANTAAVRPEGGSDADEMSSTMQNHI